MALSGLDIYKLLAKTNCRECGFVTCLAFAMQLAKKAVSIDKCPYLSEEAKKILEESGQPPIKLVAIGDGDTRLELGNETVLFRHEEKFHHPCGIGFIIEDSLSEEEILKRVSLINKLKFERVGQNLDVNLIAIKQLKDKASFLKASGLVANNTNLCLAFICEDISTIEDALKIHRQRRPLIFCTKNGTQENAAKLAKEYSVPLVVSNSNLEKLSEMTKEVNKTGYADIILDTGEKSIKEKIWDFTQLRRLALKKSNRSLGYPLVAIVNKGDPYEEAMEAATYIAKYASLVLLKGIDTWEVLSLLTVRQNIYTDPQKPLQIEPGLYPIGDVNEESEVLITTNFSLSYYTVLGEVEASKIPSYILSVDTEGMSVLTAWAAEKFTPERINVSIEKFGVKERVGSKRVVIPGYVSVMSGDLEETSGLKVLVGPKEAAGIPSFLKNL